MNVYFHVSIPLGMLSVHIRRTWERYYLKRTYFSGRINPRYFKNQYINTKQWHLYIV